MGFPFPLGTIHKHLWFASLRREGTPAWFLSNHPLYLRPK
jgi:hypothetical protein